MVPAFPVVPHAVGLAVGTVVGSRMPAIGSAMVAPVGKVELSLNEAWPLYVIPTVLAVALETANAPELVAPVPEVTTATPPWIDAVVASNPSVGSVIRMVLPVGSGLTSLSRTVALSVTPAWPVAKSTEGEPRPVAAPEGVPPGPPANAGTMTGPPAVIWSIGSDPRVAGAFVVIVHCVGVPDGWAEVTELVAGLVSPVRVTVTVLPAVKGEDPA